MNYPTYRQNDDEREYHIVKESVKAAMNGFERLRPDQQQRLLQKLMQEQAMEKVKRRMRYFCVK